MSERAKVQEIGSFLVVHLGRFEGMPKELADVRLFFHSQDDKLGRIYADVPNRPFVQPAEVPEPTAFVAGILEAARQLEKH